MVGSHHLFVFVTCMEDHGWIMAERLRLGYNLEVTVRLWLDHGIHIGLKYTVRVGPTDMHDMWYFREPTKLCAYSFVV